MQLFIKLIPFEIVLSLFYCFFVFSYLCGGFTLTNEPHLCLMQFTWYYYLDQAKLSNQKLPSGEFLICAFWFIKVEILNDDTCVGVRHTTTLSPFGLKALERLSYQSSHRWAETRLRVFWLLSQHFSEALCTASVNNFANVITMLLMKTRFIYPLLKHCLIWTSKMSFLSTITTLVRSKLGLMNEQIN